MAKLKVVKPPFTCLRCDQAMSYHGRRHFEARAGAKGIFGSELTMGVYACSACGHVELFLESGGALERVEEPPRRA